MLGYKYASFAASGNDITVGRFYDNIYSIFDITDWFVPLLVSPLAAVGC
jgi:hypothetical protein